MLIPEDQLHPDKVTKSENQIQEATGIIQTPLKNLSSKIDSILRSLENLSNKKLRIEYEIKKQKLSLLKKREELKKAQRSTSRKLRVSLESSDPIGASKDQQELAEFQRECSILLEKSQRVLDE